MKLTEYNPQIYPFFLSLWVAKGTKALLDDFEIEDEGIYPFFELKCDNDNSHVPQKDYGAGCIGLRAFKKTLQ